MRACADQPRAHLGGEYRCRRRSGLRRPGSRKEQDGEEREEGDGEAGEAGRGEGEGAVSPFRDSSDHFEEKSQPRAEFSVQNSWSRNEK